VNADLCHLVEDECIYIGKSKSEKSEMSEKSDTSRALDTEEEDRQAGQRRHPRST
jgi:hypothetical protein